MRLVYTASGRPVEVGGKVETFRGDVVEVVSFQPPHKPSSSGKVFVRDIYTGHEMEYYVGVIGAEWIEREDR